MHTAVRLLACAVLALAACDQPQTARQSTANMARPQIAPQFDDATPHDWQGRSPQDHPVHGIDIARFQTQINWPSVRASGVSFAFIKATEGGDLLDPMFKKSWRAARHAGVTRGAYHFFYHCRPAIEQARWFIANVPRTRGALPPVLDMEWTPTSPTCTRRRPAAEVRREATIFMDALEAHYGQRPLLYTTVDFYRDNQLARLPRTEFWLRSVAGHPAGTYAGQPWTFWQYTGTGRVPGIEGVTDINAFVGSEAGWNAWLAKRTQ